jgi:hypothetical protein
MSTFGVFGSITIPTYPKSTSKGRGKLKLENHTEKKKENILRARKLTVGISGGLGNQLFQLCAAIRLQKKGFQVELDPIYNDLNQIRKTQIIDLSTGFGIKEKTRGVGFRSLLRIKLLAKIYLRYLHRITTYEIDNFSTPELIVHNGTKRIFGYWQHAKVAEEIGTSLSRLIRQTEINGIAIHVRRGDYLNSQHYIHGALSGDYYTKAINLLTEKYGTQKIMIFTDSPEILLRESWLHSFNKNDVKFSVAVDPWETLTEMANYSFLICSNSTFSWWAAFLGNQKEVILPSKWFRETLLPTELVLPNSAIVEASFIDGSDS